VIDGGGDLRRIRRRPRDWEGREAEDDCRFISENRRWDTGTDSTNERWLKRRAREYCLDGVVTLMADPD
jgi:hypothetical protein